MTTRYRTAFAVPSGFAASAPKSDSKVSQPKAKKAGQLDLGLRTAAKGAPVARPETHAGSEAA